MKFKTFGIATALFISTFSLLDTQPIQAAPTKAEKIFKWTCSKQNGKVSKQACSDLIAQMLPACGFLTAAQGHNPDNRCSDNTSYWSCADVTDKCYWSVDEKCKGTDQKVGTKEMSEMFKESLKNQSASKDAKLIICYKPEEPAAPAPKKPKNRIRVLN